MPIVKGDACLKKSVTWVTCAGSGLWARSIEMGIQQRKRFFQGRADAWQNIKLVQYES